MATPAKPPAKTPAAPRKRRTTTAMSKDGTPNRLAITPAKASRYLQAIAGGNYMTTAAAYAGVTHPTVTTWRRIAERETALWDQAHPDAPLEDVLHDWVEQHPHQVGNVPYAAHSPALTVAGPEGIPAGYWQCIVLSYLHFKAEAEAEVAMVARIRAAAQNPNHWTAAMTFLERRHPDRWRRRDQMAVEGVAGGAPVQVQQVSTDDLVAKITALKAQQGAPVDMEQGEDGVYHAS